MNKKNFKLFFRTLLTKFGSVATDNGTLYWDSDDELAVGMAVQVEDNSNPDDITYVVAPDGDYTAEDGTVYTVADGAIADIKKPEEEEAPVQEEMDEELAPTPNPIEEAIPATPEPEAEPEFDAKEAYDALVAAMAELVGRVDALQSNVNALLAQPGAESLFSKQNKQPKAKAIFRCGEK